MGRTINWGIIGPGKIANRFASSFKSIPDARLYAVASRDLEKARSFARLYGFQKSYDNYDALANDPEVDVVYIATPHAYHREQTLLCLHNKKAVLCEKPLTLSHNDALEMVEAARKNNVFFMEAMWSRFFPTTIKTLKLIRDGAIGEVKYLRADFGFKSPTNDPNSRLFDLALGGGALLDVGVYPLFLALLILGKPDAVKSFATLANTGADETTNAIFQYKNGAIASILSSIVVDTPKTAEIIGTNGTITINTPWHKASSLTLRNGDDDTQFDFPYDGTGFEYQIQEVMRCLHNNKTQSDLMPFELSLMMAEVSDEIRKQCNINYSLV